jgi:large subunit ribosomal protein L31
MKKKIHPKYNKETAIKCACGNTFKVGSTVEKIDIEICNDCHPFYTGKEKLVDSTGRVDRFKQRMEKMEALKPKKTKAVKKDKVNLKEREGALVQAEEAGKEAPKEVAEKTEDKK